jgi:hypothetical protein
VQVPYYQSLLNQAKAAKAKAKKGWLRCGVTAQDLYYIKAFKVFIANF